MELAAFRAEFPEFASAGDDLVQSFLAKAAARVDPAVWGIWTAEGTGNLAAHLLANSPNGQMARLTSEKGVSTYWTDYVRRRDEVTCGLARVP